MTGTDSLRAYGAILIFFVVGTVVAAVLIGLLRLVGPDADFARRGRLPAWWLTMSAWARSRSLRLWCPDPDVARSIAAHMRTETGRRLSRLGVSITTNPADADVIVVARSHAERLDYERSRCPQPVASIVLSDPADAGEVRDALVRLSAALRWPGESTVS